MYCIMESHNMVIANSYSRSIASFWRRHFQYMPLYKNGEATIKQPVFVSDIAQGIVNAARDPDTRCQVYQAVG